jgi:nucleoside 2-deoxyribosyltransferase
VIKRIYVAGGSAPDDRARCRKVMAALRKHGFVITHDWIASFDSVEARGLTEATMAPEALIAFAEQDLTGVERADALIYVSPKHKSEGSAFELGYAHAARKLIFVLDEPRMFFSKLYATETYGSISDLIVALGGKAPEHHIA